MEKASLNRKNFLPLLIILIIAFAIVGIIYFRISNTMPNSSVSPPSETLGCRCEWNNKYECEGSLDCKTPEGIKAWEKVCECNPAGCGDKCGDAQEGSLMCTQTSC